jgi:phosphatidate cytidylyltransferase
MLLQRTLVIVVGLPVGLAAIYFGGLVYTLVVAIVLVLAAWEYLQMFRAGGLKPSGFFLLTGVALIVADRAANGFTYSPLILSGLVLGSMTYHLIAYERGREISATDFSITVGGILYLGWIGAYFISLRNLPNGLWWTLVTLSAVWLADGMAYIIGKSLGKRLLSPRLSPKKTWEGYWGGVIGGSLGGALMAFVIQATWLGPASVVTPLRGAVLGLAISLLTVLGDLGESMFKRQLGFKDSGKLLPGHGGFFDRIDSWLWAVVLGYYVVELLLKFS